MKKGKKLKLLPFTFLLTALSLTVYIPGIMLMEQTNTELASEIKEIESQIRELENVNAQLAIEVDVLKNG